MDYVRIEAAAEDDAAHFRHMLNYESKWKLKEGMSLVDTFPSDAAYRMSDDFPDNLALLDVLHNLDGNLIVNTRLRAFLEEQNVPDVEYLPVTIINHKDRVVEEDYYVVNFVKLVDCIDQAETQFTWDTLDEDVMDDVENLTIDESRIDPELKLFRLKHLPFVITIHRNLAEQMREAGFKGFKTSDLAEYRG